MVEGGGNNEAAATFVELVEALGMAEGLLGALGKISEDRLERGCLDGIEEEVGGPLNAEEGFFLALPMARLDISCNLRSSALLRAIASSTTSVDRDWGGGGLVEVEELFEELFEEFLEEEGGPCLALILPGVAPPRCFLAIGGPLEGDNSKLLPPLCIGLFITLATATKEESI